MIKFKVWDKLEERFADSSVFVITGDGHLMAIDVGTKKLKDVDPEQFEIKELEVKFNDKNWSR